MSECHDSESELFSNRSTNSDQLNLLNSKSNSNSKPIVMPMDDYRIDEQVCGQECIKAYAWRIKSSTSYFILYIILIISNAFVLVWEISGHELQSVATIIEGIITLLFVIEVSIEIITLTWQEYWLKILNRVDFIVCIICILLWLVFAIVESAPDTHHAVETEIDAVIVGIRYTLQVIRLIRFAHKGKENAEHLKHEEIIMSKQITDQVFLKHGLVSTEDVQTELTTINMNDSNSQISNRLHKSNSNSLLNKSNTNINNGNLLERELINQSINTNLLHDSSHSTETDPFIESN